MGATITADSGAVIINASGSDEALNLNHDGSGNVLLFANSGTGTNDVVGTSSTWAITSAGVASFTGINIGDDEGITFGGDDDITVEYDEDGNDELLITGAIGINGNVNLRSTSTFTQAGNAGSTVFTITAGDAVMSDGSLTITDADDAASLSVTNNTATSQSGVVSVTANAITDGTVIRSISSASGLTTGNYFDAYDGSAIVWEVGDNGANTIAGNGGDNVFTITAGDAVMSDGSLTITDADDAASLSVTNDTATSASVIAFAGSGTFTGSTTSSFMTITPSGLTTGTGVYIPLAAMTTGVGEHVVANALTTGNAVKIEGSAPNALTSGELLTLNHTSGNITGTLNKSGNLSSVGSTRTVTTGTVSDDFDMFGLTRTSVINGGGSFSATGSVLRVENAVTNSSGTVTDTVKGIEIVMDSLGTGDGVEITHAATGGVALDVHGAATSVSDVLITGTGDKANNKASLEVTNSGATAAGGSVFRVTGTGTPAAATSYLVDLDYSGATMTNNPVGVYIHGGSSTAQAVEVVSTGAGADNKGVLSVTTSGATAAGGSVLRITGTGTPAASTSYLFDFDYSGATMTNNPVTGYINLGGSTASGVHITGSGASAASSGMISLENTNTGATGVVLHTKHTSTGSAAASDAVFTLKAEGLDGGDNATEYGRLEVEIMTVTGGQEDGKFIFSTAMNDGTLTQAAMIQPRSGTATPELVMGSGAGEAFVTSNGSYDLTIDTNNGAANEPSIVLTDGASGNITITAGGTDGEIDLTSPHLTSSTQAITGSGAINVTTSITELNTTGGGSYTLADGAEGQWKYVVHVTDPGTDAVITPTNLAGGTTVTLDAIGDSVALLFTNGLWHVMGGNSHVVA